MSEANYNERPGLAPSPEEPLTWEGLEFDYHYDLCTRSREHESMLGQVVEIYRGNENKRAICDDGSLKSYEDSLREAAADSCDEVDNFFQTAEEHFTRYIANSLPESDSRQLEQLKTDAEEHGVTSWQFEVGLWNSSGFAGFNALQFALDRTVWHQLKMAADEHGVTDSVVEQILQLASCEEAQTVMRTGLDHIVVEQAVAVSRHGGVNCPEFAATLKAASSEEVALSIRNSIASSGYSFSWSQDMLETKEIVLAANNLPKSGNGLSRDQYNIHANQVDFKVNFEQKQLPDKARLAYDSIIQEEPIRTTAKPSQENNPVVSMTDEEKNRIIENAAKKSGCGWLEDPRKRPAVEDAISEILNLRQQGVEAKNISPTDREIYDYAYHMSKAAPEDEEMVLEQDSDWWKVGKNPEHSIKLQMYAGRQIFFKIIDTLMGGQDGELPF